MLTPIKPHEPCTEREFMALPGKLVRELIKRFACKEGDGRMSLESLGVGDQSLVATDSRRAIVVGEPEDTYKTTDRRCALLEAERSILYHDGYDANRILTREDEFDPANTPSVLKYPDVKQVIERIDSMEYLGTFSPEFLRDAASIGIAAGVGGIDLYINKENKDFSILGFRLEYSNPEPSFGDALKVPMSGVIMSRASKPKKGASEEDDDDAPEGDTEESDTQAAG